MTITKKLLATAALAGGVAILASAPASAYVVCDNGGDCWHTDSRYAAPPGERFTWHPDDWYFHQSWDANHRWHDYHEGHGYWRGGVWVTL